MRTLSPKSFPGLFGLLLSSLLLVIPLSFAAENVEVPDLGVHNFTSVLQETKFREGHLLIEFYAHWCPHCTHYRPEYEKIGNFFLTEPRPKPLIWVLRVDCAIKENIPICDNYKVRGYPTIYLGKVEGFLLKDMDQLTRVSPLRLDEMIAFISKTLNVKYDKGTKQEPVHEVTKKALIRKETNSQMNLDDIEHATVEIFDHLLQSEVVLQGARIRTAFLQFIALLQEAHPSKQCRSSIQYLYSHLDELWPKDSLKPKELMSKFKICGVQYKVTKWSDCAGSKPNRRGFTCGVWQLLHALTVGIEDHRVQLWVTGIEAFGQYFFGCDECAKHFIKTMESSNVREIQTKNELIMWLWETHNRVNLRLQKEEAVNKIGDPDYPKIDWPSHSMCPQCRVSGTRDDNPEWSRQKVLAFLLEFYGSTSVQEMKTMGRKELPNGDFELKAIDVFPKEDASSAESSTFHFRLYLLIMVIIAVGFVLRKRRSRNNRHRKKELP
eukprot:g8633.t1